MSKAPAVQLYTGDFLTGTSLMSNAEVGLYIRLLCLQVEKGSIPDDVSRIASAYGKDARKLWPAVREKFVAGPEAGTIVNPRMVKVMAVRDAFRDRQRLKGKASADRRVSGSTPVQPSPNPGSTPVEPIRDGDRDSTSSRKERAPEGFDDFYSAYPNKKAKTSALAAWVKMKPDERALCKPAIEAQVKANHFRGKDGQDYIPHPATWLNARRWEDELATADAPEAWNPRR